MVGIKKSGNVRALSLSLLVSICCVSGIVATDQEPTLLDAAWEAVTSQKEKLQELAESIAHNTEEIAQLKDGLTYAQKEADKTVVRKFAEDVSDGLTIAGRAGKDGVIHCGKVVTDGIKGSWSSVLQLAGSVLNYFWDEEDGLNAQEIKGDLKDLSERTKTFIVRHRGTLGVLAVAVVIYTAHEMGAFDPVYDLIAAEDGEKDQA